MKNTVTALPIKLWWSHLGKWQALAVALTLFPFLIILHFSGYRKDAAIMTTMISLLFVAFATIFRSHLVSAVSFVSLTAAFIVAFNTNMIVVSATIFFVFIVLFIISAVRELEKCGIKEMVVWLSCAAEFVLILLPMLLIRSI